MRYEITPEQLRYVIAKLREMLLAHLKRKRKTASIIRPRVHPIISRARQRIEPVPKALI